MDKCILHALLFHFIPKVLVGVFIFRLCSGKTIKQRTDESSLAVPGLRYGVTQSPGVIWPYRESRGFTYNHRMLWVGRDL